MKIKSDKNLRYSVITKSLNVFKRISTGCNNRYFTNDGELIKVPLDLANITDTLKNSIPNDIKLADISFKTYEGTYPIICKDKVSLSFSIPMAKTRYERELGKDLYIVTITKYNSETF
jgi:hypothetical protein